MVSPSGLVDALSVLALMLNREGLGWVDVVPVVARLLEPQHLKLLQTWSELTAGHPQRHAHELTGATARLLLGGLQCKHAGVVQQFTRAVHEQRVFKALLDTCRLFAGVPAYLKVSVQSC